MSRWLNNSRLARRRSDGWLERMMTRAWPEVKTGAMPDHQRREDKVSSIQ
jgi:hypothetical protein